MEIGQKIIIKEDNLNGATVTAGEILTIIDADQFTIYAESIDRNAWYFEVSDLDKGYIIQGAEEEKKQGTRYNKDKLRWRNFPLFLLEGLIEVAQKGEVKYGTYNFMDGLPINDTLDSLKRHLVDFEDPRKPDEDAETKVNHLYSVAWNAIVAAYHLETRPDLDDRIKLDKTYKKD